MLIKSQWVPKVPFTRPFWANNTFQSSAKACHRQSHGQQKVMRRTSAQEVFFKPFARSAKASARLSASSSGTHTPINRTVFSTASRNASLPVPPYSWQGPQSVAPSCRSRCGAPSPQKGASTNRGDTHGWGQKQPGRRVRVFVLSFCLQFFFPAKRCAGAAWPFRAPRCYFCSARYSARSLCTPATAATTSSLPSMMAWAWFIKVLLQHHREQYRCVVQLA